MTNQSREAFVKVHAKELRGKLEHDPYRDVFERIWQVALSEGRRRGIEEAAQVLIENECSMTGVRAVRALIVGGGEGVCATASV